MHEIPGGDSRDEFHRCLLYDDSAAHADAVAAFLKAGLRRGERCVYVVDDHQPGIVYRALRHHGIQVDEAAAQGAFIVRGKREAYLRDGRFEPATLLDHLERSAEDARAAGFRGLRMTGDLTWAFESGIPREAVLEYEARVDAAAEGLGLRALCQYDARRLPAGLLDALRATHARQV